MLCCRGKREEKREKFQVPRHTHPGREKGRSNMVGPLPVRIPPGLSYFKMLRVHNKHQVNNGSLPGFKVLWWTTDQLTVTLSPSHPGHAQNKESKEN
jgi:hypothetical protein